MLRPAKEVDVVLETSVVVTEVVLAGMTTLVVEETSVGKVALVAVEVAMDTVAVGMAVTDLVMMEATLEVAEAIMILTVTTANLQTLDPGKEAIWGAEALAPVVVEANTLPNHKTKVSMEVPAAAVAMAVVEGFNYCQETFLLNLAGEKSQKSDKESYRLQQPSGGRALLQQRRHVLGTTHVYGQKTQRLYL